MRLRVYAQPLAGFSLLELMISLAVFSLLFMLGSQVIAPATEQRELQNSAQRMQLAIRQARSLAILEGQNVRLSFARYPGGNWCYGLKLGSACDCSVSLPTDSDYCQVAQAPQRFDDVRIGPVSLVSPVTYVNPAALTINGQRGTMSAGKITLASEHFQTSLVVSSLGRLRQCANDPTQALPGATPC